MRKIILSVALATAVLVGSNSAARAQQQPLNGGFQQPQQMGGMPQPGAARPAAAPAAAPSATPPSQVGINGMAVVDVAYIFKNHARFKQEMEAMKAKVDQAEVAVKNAQTDMKALVEQSKAYGPGTPEFKRIEADLTKRQADLQVQVNLQKKDFMEQEGKIYYKVSVEVEDAVKRLATKYNIALVLRFNGDQVDASNRDDILRNINKPIVFYDPRMDITPYILTDLNRPTTGAAPMGVGNRMPAPGTVPNR